MEFNQTLLIPILLLFFSQCPTINCCYDDERTALLGFKSSLDDPSSRLASWKGQNCCKWDGIYCSDSFHVVAVKLQNPDPATFMRNLYSEIIPTSFNSTALSGTISPSLFNLSHLQYLDLSYNDFNFSTIPHEFTNLKKLTYLDVSHSKFSGSITTQFANLSSLTYLNISCSSEILDFSSISYNFTTSKASAKSLSTYFPTCHIISPDISWLRGLVNLKVLKLNGVDLKVAYLAMNWAKPISFLANLRHLYLSDCNITSPPPVNEFLNLSRLSSLRMSSNFFYSSIPIKLSNFTSLLELDFSRSRLRGSISYLPQVQQLYVGFNHDLDVNLTWMFDRSWPYLRTLSIQETAVLGSIPSTITNASSLVSLIASSCSIQGPLPTSMANLSQLQHLDLTFNNLSGYLPSSISNLKNLRERHLLQNNLQGSIPRSICKISSLQVLSLGFNNLTGRIPSCISKLVNLYALDITRNSISGTVSLASLIHQPKLIWIGLSSNRISIKTDQDLLPLKFQTVNLGLQSCNVNGPIPTFICNLTQLTNLDLAGNNLEGAIPSCVFKLPFLSYLDLSHNNLHGTLPQSLYLGLSYMFPLLNLGSNNLEGPLPLPPENIGIFDLSENNLTDGISNEVGERLSNARYVSLSGNKLSGPIPSSICSKGHLMHLDLSNNQLSGTIPSSLEYCNSLISLNLAINNLTGKVPNELNRVKSLKMLQLNENTLNGTFPSSMEQLENLEVLNLGNNNFEGSLPNFIGKLHNLKILWLRSNSFNGSIPKEITRLHKLQIINLSSNKLSGPIPENLGNLEMLTSRPNTRFILGEEISLVYSGVQLQMVIKGTIQQLLFVYNYHSAIDLSCNSLEEKIPVEIGLLKGLSILNLSHNHFSGNIPTSVGDMVGLEALDLSFNKLSGDIPESLASIHSLAVYNLSYNNLSGRIPTGPHFDTINPDGSAYIGNTFICGISMMKSCESNPSSGNDNTLPKDETEEDAREKWLIGGTAALGYGIGFWGLFLVLRLRKEKWWSGYWRAVDSVALRIAGCILKR